MKFFFTDIFSVTRDLIDHFGEEIVWLPFFSKIDLITPYYTVRVQKSRKILGHGNLNYISLIFR